MATAATPVVFVHGLWLHADSWGGWVERFRDEGYDPQAPRNLTVIVHNVRADYRWGYDNQKPGRFRPDDVVISVDGPTPEGAFGDTALLACQWRPAARSGGLRRAR